MIEDDQIKCLIFWNTDKNSDTEPTTTFIRQQFITQPTAHKAEFTSRVKPVSKEINPNLWNLLRVIESWIIILE